MYSLFMCIFKKSQNLGAFTVKIQTLKSTQKLHKTPKISLLPETPKNIPLLTQKPHSS